MTKYRLPEVGKRYQGLGEEVEVIAIRDDKVIYWDFKREVASDTSLRHFTAEYDEISEEDTQNEVKKLVKSLKKAKKFFKQELMEMSLSENGLSILRAHERRIEFLVDKLLRILDQQFNSVGAKNAQTQKNMSKAKN